MKFYKFAIPALAVAAMALTSCSDKGYWDEYTDSEASYTFVAEAQSFTFDGVPEYLTVYVNRNNQGPAVSVPVKLESSTPEITGPAQVTFEEGKTQAEYRIKPGSGLVCGVNNTVTLTIDGNVADYDISTIKLTLYRDFTYSDFGEGMYLSPEFVEYEWPVMVQRANENNRVFRIQDPFYIMDTENPGNMVITFNSSFTLATFANFYPGFELSGYNIRLVLTNYGQVDGDEVTFPVAFYAYEGNTLAGSFGTYAETVVMPQGWKD